MDALVALGDHRADAEQIRPLGRPVAGRAGAVFLSGQHDQRRAVLFVFHRRVVNRHLLVRWAGSVVTPPSVPGQSRFLMRMLANVPRVITRSLPRRLP